MINPTEQDIGRKVIYIYWDGVAEEGVITSFNDYYVFVRYGDKTQSEATLRSTLEWPK